MVESHPIPRQKAFRDLTKESPFGRWAVLGYLGGGFWLCRCSCAARTEKSVYGSNLRQGTSQSCGCLATELRARRMTTHGKAGTKEHAAWSHMIQRCCNPDNPGYPEYGARGIRVCNRWRESFEAFLADVGIAPSRRHSLDRFPDQEGNYEPGNVRWATPSEQNRNRRSNRFLTFRGLTLCQADWAKLIGVSPATITHRLRAGWPLERALTERGCETGPPEPFTFIA